LESNQAKQDKSGHNNCQRLYLEDFTVGAIFSSESQTLSKEQIIEFASQFDPQPFHTDEEAAKETFFKGLAASGWHTAAITMSLLVRSGLPCAGALVGLGADLKWPLPTRPGDRLQVETEILEIKELRSRPDSGIITMKSNTTNQERQIVQTMVTKVLIAKRPK